MWANAQRDGHPAEYRWRPLLNATKFGWRPLLVLCTCSHAAKMRNTLTFAGVPQTRQEISAGHWMKFTILWEHVQEIVLFNSFFPTVNTCLSCEDIARQSCVMVPRWHFLGPAFPASRAQYKSDLHSKFALGPHHMQKYGRHPICDHWD